MTDFLHFIFPGAPISREKQAAQEILAALKMEFVSDEQRRAVFASIADSSSSNNRPKLGKGLEEIDTFTGGKAVMTSDGKIIKNIEGPRSHTQIFARMVENNPENYDRRTVDWAKEVIKTDKEEFSALESAAMDKNGAIKLERDFMGNLTIVYSDGGLRATSDQFNNLYRKVKSAVRNGRISIPKAERIAIHYNSSFAGIDYWDIDTISGFSVNEFGRPIPREKEFIAALKGGPGSGNFGHAGRPGEVGGSAHIASYRVGDNLSRDDVINYIEYTNPPEQVAPGSMTMDEWADKYLSDDSEYRIIEIDPRAANLPANTVESKVAEYSELSGENAPPIVIDSNDKLEARFGGGKLDQAYGRQPDTVIDGKHRVEAALQRGDKSINAIVPSSRVNDILSRSHGLEVEDFAKDYFNRKGYPIIKFDGHTYSVNRNGTMQAYGLRDIDRIAKNTGHSWRFQS